MGDTLKYWEEQTFEPSQEEELSEDVLSILQLFRLLTAIDKVVVKKLLREESIF